MRLFAAGALCLLALPLLSTSAACADSADSVPATTPTVAQIVAQMQSHNLARNEDLKHYQSLRHYEVHYHGFPANVDAKMEVEVDYDSASGKSFRIVSQSGSRFLCDKVLKRAVDSEDEAQKNQSATALTSANYNFTLEGRDSVDGRPAYILDVQPIAPSKFLYKGKIWVDARDFAVEKVEATPARNPSFWISQTLIRYTSAKNGEFWLPHQNRSETKVRIGGTAVFTIDYGAYQIVPQIAVAKDASR
jgi:outer membrane lipoprotein-sorting protein